MRGLAFLGTIGVILLLLACGNVTSLQNQCHVDTTDLMPSSEVPPGGQIVRAAYSGNVTEGINFVTVKSSLSVSQLLDHYNSQIAEQRSDWHFLDSDTTSHMAWSSWNIVDECGVTWEGLLTISKPPSASDPFITVRVRQHNP